MDGRVENRCTGNIMQTISRATGYDVFRSLPQTTVAATTQVVVQRDWSGWRKAMAPFAALENVHWHQPAGAPRPLIHAYVSCRDLISGDVPHECTGHAPHKLLVCILRQHTAPSVFQTLVERANAAGRL
jgi:hypothetical protein